MNPFIKRTLAEHIQQLNEIKARNLPRIEKIDRIRIQHKENLKLLAREKIDLKQEIINKENYVKTLEGI